jgi:hypothetical protein
VEAGLSDGALTEVRPSDPDGLVVDDPLAIGLSLSGEAQTGAPTLSLKGRR